jgi:hypothetical protein
MAKRSHPTDVLEARPWLDRQNEGNLWLLWRSAESDRREGLLAAGFPVCTNPACDCSEVQVDLQGVDDGLMRAESSGDRLRLAFIPDRPAAGVRGAAARLVIDSEAGERCRQEGDRRLVDWFVDSLDTSLLEALRGAVRAAKARAANAPAAPVPTPEAAGRLGRNDPCPCGSGKKYKRCCGG